MYLGGSRHLGGYMWISWTCLNQKSSPSEANLISWKCTGAGKGLAPFARRSHILSRLLSRIISYSRVRARQGIFYQTMLLLSLSLTLVSRPARQWGRGFKVTMYLIMMMWWSLQSTHLSIVNIIHMNSDHWPRHDMMRLALSDYGFRLCRRGEPRVCHSYNHHLLL